MAEHIIQLAPMSKEDFHKHVLSREEDYAQERSRNLETNIGGERKVAKEQFAEMSRDFESGRVKARFMQEGGNRVGYLAYSYDGDRRLVYLLYIKVFEAYRRKGYARAALRLLEKEAVGLGADKIGLNVFGDNDHARQLYEKAGYRFAFQGMHKRLRRDR